LSSHCNIVEINNLKYVCRSNWIVGCKQWHLGNSFENEYKYKFRKIINSITSSHNILLAIGEIDFRVDDGILKHARKYWHSLNFEDTLHNAI
jgi:hypothetical protein